MSDYKVPYTTIKAINPHSGADKLEIAMVYGFQVVVPKGRYKVGDSVVYVPIDSILPPKLEAHIFPEGSKVKLSGSRVRQIRLRGLASQGMLIDINDLFSFINIRGFDLEDNLAEALSITKYEPPFKGSPQTIGGDKQRNKKSDHPLFHKYNGLDNIKWFPDLFSEGEEVVIQCKMHGTNARASLLPFIANTFWKKIKKFLRLAPVYEKCYGSNNVEISSKLSYSGFYGEDLYGAVFKKIDVFSKLTKGETVFGEIIGPGIQKNYEYGLKEHKFLLFDVKYLKDDGTQEWLTPDEVEKFAKERGFDMVPVLYKGAFNKQHAYSLSIGPSVFDPKTKVREGIVIKAATKYSIDGNKKALKLINEQYLDDKSNSDFH